MGEIAQRLAKQPFGGDGIAQPRKQEINRGSGGIDGPIQVAPAALHSNVGHAEEVPCCGIQPYVEGGVALSHLSVNDVVELNHRNNYGIVLGAGVSLHLGPLRIAPELRYSGWTFRNFDSPGGLLQSNSNHASVLVGIDF